MSQVQQPTSILTRPVLIRGIDPRSGEQRFVRIAPDRCSMSYHHAGLHRPHTVALSLPDRPDVLRLERQPQGQVAAATMVAVYGRFSPFAGEHQRLVMRLWDPSPLRLYVAMYRSSCQPTLDHYRSTLLLDSRNVERFRNLARLIAFCAGGALTAELGHAFYGWPLVDRDEAPPWD